MGRPGRRGMSAAADRAQRQASDPRLSVFVTANAGSGKTKVLVDRIARLLLEGAQPSAFLCITYTKAAAAEMQRRLYRQLGDWCVAPDEALRAQLNALEGRPADAALSDETIARARSLFAQALESPGGLKIQTIHAFCERLLARFPLEAGVAPGFDIADDAQARAMLEQSWSEAAAARDGAVHGALERFGARLADEPLQNLLRALVDARTAVRSFVAAQGGVERALDAVARRHGAVQTSDDIARAAIAAAPWAALAEAIGTLEASDAKTMGDLAVRIRAAIAARDAEPLAAWAAYRDIFFTSGGTPYKSLLTATLKRQSPALDHLLDRAQGQAIAADNAIRAAERAADAQSAVILGHALDAQYARVKAARGVLDFSDLIEHALALLTRGAAAPWVLYKLDGGLQHILIDEGQDTSPEQWRLIAPLQDEFFSGDGVHDKQRTVFAVGDPKQSIYSFQGAHPQTFLDQSQALSSRAAAGGRGFAATPLETSFRSSPEVLKAVDETFSEENLGGDTPGLFDIVRHLAARSGEAGRVEWWPFAPRPDLPPDNGWKAPQDIVATSSAQTKLAEAVAVRVRDWIGAGEAVWDRGRRRAMRPGDVLILVRSRGPLFSQVLMALKRVGLPVAGADRILLRDELAVQDCLSLLRVAADPQDDLALACLMKSPLIGLLDDEADLFPLAHGRAPHERLFARLMASSDPRYATAQDFVRLLIDHARDGPFGVMSWALETCDGDGRSGWARFFARLGEECRDPLEELLGRALSAHQRGAATLDAFLAEVETEQAEVKREMEDGGDAVRVMTIHGAKGLEAPVVILPDTTGPPRQQGDDQLFITPQGPVFSASSGDDDPCTAQARTAWRARQDEEHLRLLYVAMTRARDRLIVCGVGRGQGRGKADARSWHALVERAMARIGPDIETPFGRGFALGALSAVDRDTTAAAVGVAPAWSRTPAPIAHAARSAAPSTLMKDGVSLSPRAAGGARFRRGLLIHGLLERLPDIDGALRADAARTWLASQGVDAREAATLAAEAMAVIEDARFAHAFGPGSRGEQPIIGRVGAIQVRGVVDRLVIGADRVDVLDFKSDRPSPADPAETPEGYVLQMALYRAVLAQIFPARAIRCALIWTERPIMVELPAALMDTALAALERS
ncbi:MAG: double-strand break repair helicase AddA [Alphaproteobacteria bacterium]|nr:double-strand break repair helicase AddA [Alphaproteobacteria bacterium]